MSRKERSDQTPVVGGSSLVVIFAVLCLTVFALLSLSTVKADKRLADINEKAVENYYAADLEAEKMLSEIRAGNLPEGVTVSGNVYSYSCPVSETQKLCVEVKVTKSGFDIIRWQTASTTEWTESDGLAVWHG
ncbi:MAG: hypothetical protein IJ283_00120 [Oscillospiraceae bacterium]|nr:hypothetical protein [Oscillospiraceae bacterium]